MTCTCIISYFSSHDFDACVIDIVINNIINNCKVNILLQDDKFCNRCNRNGHDTNDCYSRRHSDGTELIKFIKNKCYRCKRIGHDTIDCDSNIDIDGDYL